MLLYPCELLSNENNRARKKAQALMIAFGLGVKMEKIMRKGKGGDFGTKKEKEEKACFFN